MLYYVIKYTIYIAGFSFMIHWSRSNWFKLLWVKYSIISNLLLFKKKATVLYRTNIMPIIYTPSEDIFYYKNNNIVAKTTIINLVIGKECYRGDYDFVTYEIANDFGEKMYRIFDNHYDILVELGEKYQIECVPSTVRIISALLVITRNNMDELYDVTPKGLGVELQHNKLYSHSFMNYFFNINPTMNYSVKIIDSNINEFELVNTPQQCQFVCIKDDHLEIVTLVADIRNNDAPKNFVDKIKQLISRRVLRIKD
jgi:hypothetical protein